MYQEFSIVSTDTLLAEKKFIITANQDIDINSLTDTVITIFERETKSPVMFKAEASGKIITVTLQDWPIPNSEYIVLVKDLKSVTGDSLISSKYHVKFDSAIKTLASIVTPSMHEKISEIKITVKEELVDPTSTLINEFYIELSTDNTFINTIQSTTLVGRTDIVLNSLPYGQYYLRVRVQNGINSTIQYSKWSDVITFTFANKDSTPIIVDPTEPYPDPNAPIVIDEELEIVSRPESGTTPNSILIEFNCPIDELSLDKIVIIRREVK